MRLRVQVLRSLLILGHCVWGKCRGNVHSNTYASPRVQFSRACTGDFPSYFRNKFPISPTVRALITDPRVRLGRHLHPKRAHDTEEGVQLGRICCLRSRLRSARREHADARLPAPCAAQRYNARECDRRCAAARAGAPAIHARARWPTRRVPRSRKRGAPHRRLGAAPFHPWREFGRRCARARPPSLRGPVEGS